MVGDGATWALPAEAGTDPNRPPVLACYITDRLNAPTPTWLVVSDASSTTGPRCGLVFNEGRWNAVIIRGISGWFVSFVVVY